MTACWTTDAETGLLIQPEPYGSLVGIDNLNSDHIAEIEASANQLVSWLEERTIRDKLVKLPLLNVQGLIPADSRVQERAFQYYSYFASAYIHAPQLPPTKHLPAVIAVPLVALAEMVKRPPILAYASYTLANWRKRDPDGAMVIENLDLLQRFMLLEDAAWFTLVHVEIEAEAAPALRAIPLMQNAIHHDDHQTLETGLATIHRALDQMMTTLKRMPEGCHPHQYYHEVRPYIFGFDDVIYEGVAQYAGKPQLFRGETGAQSSVIPALIQALGLKHASSGLTEHLTIMRDYMPYEHRQWLATMDGTCIRQAVEQSQSSSLRLAYNETIRQVMQFRSLHLRFAASYIANQSPDALGTGGTTFMTWLQRLIDETESQLLC